VTIILERNKIVVLFAGRIEWFPLNVVAVLVVAAVIFVVRVAGRRRLHRGYGAIRLGRGRLLVRG